MLLTILDIDSDFPIRCYPNTTITGKFWSCDPLVSFVIIYSNLF